MQYYVERLFSSASADAHIAVRQEIHRGAKGSQCDINNEDAIWQEQGQSCRQNR